MRRPWTIVAAMLLGGACASSGALHGGRTALGPQETAVVVRTKENSAAGFRRLWKSPGLQPWALLKWDQDHSSAVPAAPPGLLQSIRDEVGRLNQHRAKGDDLSLTVTVYQYDKAGWFSDPRARYELVARNKKGEAVWAVDDEIPARRELAQTLVDGDESLLARAVAGKLRQEFGL